MTKTPSNPLPSLADHLQVGTRDIAWRLKAHEIDEQTVDAVRALADHVIKNSQNAVDQFYQQILRQPEAAAIIGDAESLARLKASLKRYLIELVSAEYDADYIYSRLRIGQVHKRIGVSIKYFVPALRHLNDQIRRTILSAESLPLDLRRSAVVALEKAIYFDMSLVIETYVYSFMNDIERQRLELQQYSDQLEEKTKQLQELAGRDTLTGLYNQRILREELQREIARAKRRGTNVTLVFFDLDGFKVLNDTQGHLVGDQCLVALAHHLRDTVRETDTACRFGGDEFAVILSDASLEAGGVFYDRYLDAANPDLEKFGVSLSVGMAVALVGSSVDADKLIRTADQAMYAAKPEPGNSLVITHIERNLEASSDSRKDVSAIDTEVA